MKKSEAKNRLEKAAAGPEYERNTQPSEGNLIVKISGLNKISRDALFDNKLIIRHFPFLIGKTFPGQAVSFSGPDFLIAEDDPGHISRNHLSIELRNGQIYLADEASRFGSMVNDKRLGKNIGGLDSVPLKYGKSVVRMGGRSSPFIFEFEVNKNSEGKLFKDSLRCGDRIVPIASLYFRLCMATKEIISSSGLDNRERISMALKLSAFIAEDINRSEMLHCYAAHPDTFSDIIVAHSINVCIYAIQLARGRNYSSEDLINIGAAALLHDIGMNKVPKEIVYKNETISPDEFEIMKRHTTDGYNELSIHENDLKSISSVVLEHHERIDGSGYPQGKDVFGEIAELIGLVDFFEAVTHHRPQRGPITPHEGVQLLIACKYAPFSPRLLKAFIKRFSLFPVFSIVRLNSGELGQVIQSNPGCILRPVVRILFDSYGQPRTDMKTVDLSKEMDLFIIKDISDRIFIDKYFQI